MRNVRKRRALLLIAVAVAVLAVAALLLVRAIFVTRNVVIEGTVSASDEEIIRAANLNLGGPIGDVREEDVRKIWKKRANMRWTVWRFAAPARWCSMCASARGTQWFRWAGAFWSRIPTATSSKSATRCRRTAGCTSAA